MTTDKTVEFVARALCAADGYSWRDLQARATSPQGNEDERPIYLANAEVAIKAHLECLMKTSEETTELQTLEHAVRSIKQIASFHKEHPNEPNAAIDMVTSVLDLVTDTLKTLETQQS